MSRERQEIQLPDGPADVSADEVEDVEYDDDMTEQRAAAIVDAVHASEEYRKARETSARRRGRPSLSGQAGVSARVGFRLPKDEQLALESFAKKRGKKVGAIVREAVDEYMSRHAS